MIPFFRWISDYYIHPIGEVIKSALPGGLNVYDICAYGITESGERVFCHGAVAPPNDNSIDKIDKKTEKKILGVLKKGFFSRRELTAALGQSIPDSLLFAMERKGWIVRKRRLKRYLANIHPLNPVTVAGFVPSMYFNSPSSFPDSSQVLMVLYFPDTC